MGDVFHVRGFRRYGRYLFTAPDPSQGKGLPESKRRRLCRWCRGTIPGADDRQVIRGIWPVLRVGCRCGIVVLPEVPPRRSPIISTGFDHDIFVILTGQAAASGSTLRRCAASVGSWRTRAAAQRVGRRALPPPEPKLASPRQGRAKRQSLEHMIEAQSWSLCKSDTADFVLSAAVRAIFHLIPAFRPSLAPNHGPTATQAGLFRQIGFLAVFGHLVINPKSAIPCKCLVPRFMGIRGQIAPLAQLSISGNQSGKGEHHDRSICSPRSIFPGRLQALFTRSIGRRSRSPWHLRRHGCAQGCIWRRIRRRGLRTVCVWTVKT